MDSYRIFQEALSSIRQNKARSALSGFGVAWGIFILTVLLYVGGGIGLYITPVEMGGYKTRYQVPIFAEIKYSFLDRLVSPFVDLKAGGFYDYTLGGTGYVIRPSIGVDIWRFSTDGISEDSVTQDGMSGCPIISEYNEKQDCVPFARDDKT